MINWSCTQCGENLEAPDGFAEVIECPKCGNHSRPRTGPPPVSVKIKPVEEEPKSSNKSEHDKKTSLFFWKISTGKFFIGVGIVVLGIALFMNTTYNDVHNIGLLNNRLVTAIIGAAILVSGAIFTTRDSSN